MDVDAMAPQRRGSFECFGARISQNSDVVPRPWMIWAGGLLKFHGSGHHMLDWHAEEQPDSQDLGLAWNEELVRGRQGRCEVLRPLLLPSAAV